MKNLNPLPFAEEYCTGRPEDKPQVLYMCYHLHMCEHKMANMTLSIPDDIHKDMKQFSDIRWSEVARRAIVERIEALKQVEEIAKKSKLTAKDAKKIGELIKREANKQFMNENNP
jgi:hypothetical protein